MNILPQKIEDLIESFSLLPGIGPKSAARIVFYLQKAPEELSLALADTLVGAKRGIKTCSQCYNLSDEKECYICQNEERDRSKILVVEDALDLVAIENTGFYQGLYHVLGGIISPINGIGPEEIRIKELLDRITSQTISELIVATNPNMEGEATALYIQNEVKKIDIDLDITRLAQGLAMGADIDYTDDTTIQKALEGRKKL